MVRRRMRSRDESTYRKRHQSGAEFFTSRALYDDLAVVIRRFPTREGVPAGARTCVLVHGIGVSSRYFHPVAAELAKCTRVYLVDLPGYGSAPDPKRDVSIKDHADVLARFLEDAGIEHPILIGHSMGTQVVTQLVLDSPETTDRIVLMAPVLDREFRRFWRATGKLLQDAFLNEPPYVGMLVAVDYFFRCGIPYFIKQSKHLLADRMEERLPLLDVEALVIRGDRDGISRTQWGREMTGLMKHAAFAEVRGPHAMMFTDPKRIAELIVEFSQE